MYNVIFSYRAVVEFSWSHHSERGLDLGKDTCARRLSMLIRSRRQATGMGQIRFLETVPQSDGLPEVNQDYLCYLEYGRRTVPLDEPEFWLVTTMLGISPEEVVR